MDAVGALRAGQPVVLPTDTVYGLCADAASETACRRALALKSRPERQPSALVCADLDALLERVPELPEAIVRALLPGAYTLPGVATPGSPMTRSACVCRTCPRSPPGLWAWSAP